MNHFLIKKRFLENHLILSLVATLKSVVNLSFESPYLVWLEIDYFPLLKSTLFTFDFLYLVCILRVGHGSFPLYKIEFFGS